MRGWMRISGIVLASGVWLVGASHADAGRADLGAIVRRYENAKTAEERIEAIALFGECTSARCVPYLAKIARRDPSTAVRSAAVGALAERADPGATATLLEICLDGGVQRFRAACVQAVGRRTDAVELITPALESKRFDVLDRVRLVEALGGVPSLDAYALLLGALDSPEPNVRSAALRAVAVHPIGSAEIGDTLVDVLRRHHDVETVVAALDLVEDLALDRWPEIEPLVAAKKTPSIEEAVIALGLRHAFVEGMKLAARKEAEGYALGADEIPREPQPRTRLDVVYAFDATGSTVGQIDQVKAFITEHAGPLVMVRHDARIGIVAYRVGEKATSRTRTEVLPLTHDVDAAVEFVKGIDQRGADSQGAAVADAVATALDRMPWRANARRRVYLLADGRIDDPPRAWRIARRHREEDRTQLSVWYWSNTRQRRPTDLKKLAELGGGTFTIADPTPIPRAPWPGGGAPPTGR